MSAGARAEKIRTLVVDDEPLARSNVAVLLRQDPTIEIVGECGSGLQAVKEIRSRRPDLVFLDVQMPECDGFDVVEKLGGDLPAAVVFVTAYDQYALKAFEAGALDYLLKPFDNARFARALARAKEKVVHTRESPVRRDRLVVKGAGQITFVKISEIDWIEASDYYASLHVPGELIASSPSRPRSSLGINTQIFLTFDNLSLVKLKAGISRGSKNSKSTL